MDQPIDIPIPPAVQQTVFSEAGFIQLAVTLGAVILGFVLRALLAHRIERALKKRKPSLITRVMHLLIPLMAPVFALMFMAMGYFGLISAGVETNILRIAVQIMLLWFALSGLQSFTESSMAKLSGALFIIPLIGLSLSGLLAPLIKFLKELSFEISDTKISAYNVLSSIIAVIILIWIAGLLNRAIEGYVRKFQRLRASDRQLILKIWNVILYVAIFLIALNIMGVDLTALAVLGGAVGVGIGFGLQKIASNFISGIILLFEKSVEVDDLVELADGTFGSIRRTYGRYTLLETPEGKEVFIPNEEFIINRVNSWTHSNKRGRIEIPVGVAYDTDLELAQRLILEAATEHPRTVQEPQPQCYLREFADSSINFLLLFFVGDVDNGRFQPQSEVMFSIWRKFKEHDIEIPFPQRDVNIKSLPPITLKESPVKKPAKDAKTAEKEPAVKDAPDA